MSVVNTKNLTHDNVCDGCQKSFTHKYSLKRHLELNRCSITKDNQLKKNQSDLNQILVENRELRQQMTELKSSLFNSELQQQMTELRTELKNVSEKVTNIQPHIAPPTTIINNINSNLQVMCVNSNDNFLDVLTSRSNAQDALTFIKDCALSRLAGDCRLLEKVYFSTIGTRPPIMTMNQTRTRFVYYDENNKKTLETNPKILARKLADCLQRTYLKGINLYRTDVSDPDSLKVNHIESYDVEDWNEHIHDLSDEKYQKKILDRLKIPNVVDV